MSSNLFLDVTSCATWPAYQLTINQSVLQSINQLNNQNANQSINQSRSHSPSNDAPYIDWTNCLQISAVKSHSQSVDNLSNHQSINQSPSESNNHSINSENATESATPIKLNTYNVNDTLLYLTRIILSLARSQPHLVHQSINQLMIDTREWTYQSFNQSVNQAINQLINQSNEHSNNSTNQPIMHPMMTAQSQSADNQSINQPTNQSMNPVAVNQFLSQLIEHTNQFEVNTSKKRKIDSVNQSNDPSFNQSTQQFMQSNNAANYFAQSQAMNHGQAVNQSTNQSRNDQSEASMSDDDSSHSENLYDPSIHQSVSQLNILSGNLSANHLMHHPMNQSISQSDAPPLPLFPASQFTHPLNQSIIQANHHGMHPHMPNQGFNQSVNQSMNQSISQPINSSVNQSTGQKHILHVTPRVWTTEDDERLIKFANTYRYRGLVSWKQIDESAQFVGHNPDSLRRRWEKLKKLDPKIDQSNNRISSVKSEPTRNQSINQSINQESPVNDLLSNLSSFPPVNDQSDRKRERSRRRARKRARNQSINQSINQSGEMSDAEEELTSDDSIAVKTPVRASINQSAASTKPFMAHVVTSPIPVDSSIKSTDDQSINQSVKSSVKSTKHVDDQSINQSINQSSKSSKHGSDYSTDAENDPNSSHDESTKRQVKSINRPSINLSMTTPSRQSVNQSNRVFQCLVAWNDDTGVQRRCEYFTTQRTNLNKHHRKHQDQSISLKTPMKSQTSDLSINDQSINETPLKSTSGTHRCSHCGFRSTGQHVSAHLRRCHSQFDRELMGLSLPVGMARPWGGEHTVKWFLLPHQEATNPSIDILLDEPIDNQSTNQSINQSSSTQSINQSADQTDPPTPAIIPVLATQIPTSHEAPIPALLVNPFILDQSSHQSINQSINQVQHNHSIRSSREGGVDSDLDTEDELVDQSIVRPSLPITSPSSHVRGYWSPEDNERLMRAVAENTNQAGKIQWTRFVEQFPNRSTTTLRAHYRYTMQDRVKKEQANQSSFSQANGEITNQSINQSININQSNDHVESSTSSAEDTTLLDSMTEQAQWTVGVKEGVV